MHNPVELRGSDFGLRVDRPRLFEANFSIRVDDCVRRAGDRLRARCCQGRRRRWRDLDVFGRPTGCWCCWGNTFALLGSFPWRCTLAECSEAMGVDAGHMSCERLAQSIPPSYGQLVFAQMCMARAHEKFGVPVITFDDWVARPAESARVLSKWLRGAGASSPDLALELRAVAAERPQLGAETVSDGKPSIEAADVCDVPPSGRAESSAEALCFRELFYSHAGGFDQKVLTGGAGGSATEELASLSPSCPTVGAEVWRPSRGSNTYIEARGGGLKRIVRMLAGLPDGEQVGSRVTIKVEMRHASLTRRAGMLPVSGKLDGMTSPLGFVYVCWGRRGGGTKESWLDHDLADSHMDPKDLGIGEEPKARKEARAWLPYPWDPAKWVGRGVAKPVEELMTNGAQVEYLTDRGAYEVKQYPYPSGEALAECLLEADRSLVVGQMEYVPDEMIREVMQSEIVHPWLIVQQGAKWRACHDYSVGTNRSATTAPFGLPTPWEVRRVWSRSLLTLSSTI